MMDIKVMAGKISMLLLVAVLLCSTAAFAQPRGGRMQGARMERVHSMKIAFITDRLQLSSAQAERFWPVYNSYEKALRETRSQFMKNRRTQGQKQDMTDEEALQRIEDNLEMQEAMIDLKKRYKDEFLKVLSANQLADLYQAEKDFRQMLMKELRERRAKGQNMRQRMR